MHFNKIINIQSRHPLASEGRLRMCSPHIYVPGGVWDTYDAYFVNIHYLAPTPILFATPL